MIGKLKILNCMKKAHSKKRLYNMSVNIQLIRAQEICQLHHRAVNLRKCKIQCKVITFYINCKIILQSKPQNRQQYRIWITLWEDNFAFKKNIPYKIA